MQEADPCSLVTDEVAARYGLSRDEPADSGATSQVCSWSAGQYRTLGILVSADQDTMVDLSKFFPVAGGNVRIEGTEVVVLRNDKAPACAAFFLPETGTVVAVFVRDQDLVTTAAACARTKEVAASTILKVVELDLFKTAPSRHG